MYRTKLALDRCADYESVDDFVLLEDTDADPLIQLTSDRINKSLQQLLLSLFVIARFDFLYA